MKKGIITFALLLLSWGVSFGEIPRDPDYSILWNQFSSVVMVDSFAVVTTKEALVVLGPDTSSTLKPVNQLFMPTEPYQQKRSGTVITVRSRDNILYFVDISNLPDIQLLGQADLQMPFSDYALFGQDLYVCNGFKGLLRYTMINYGSLTFADSSMRGIHYTRVDIYGDEMYALDDYNGILRYKLSGFGFGDFVDMAYVPLRATSFTKVDTMLAIAINGRKLMLASMGESSPHVTASYDLLIVPKRVFAIDSFVVAIGANASIAEMINLNSLEQTQFELADPPDSLVQGQTLMRDGAPQMLLPTASGGLALYNLDQITVDPMPMPLLARPGPIADVYIKDKRLYTGGPGNPLDIITIDSTGKPLKKDVMYSLTRIRAMDLDGDILAAYYNGLRNVLLLNIETDPVVLDQAVFIGDKQVNELVYNDTPIDTMRSLFVGLEYSVESYVVSDSGFIAPGFDINVIDKVRALTVMDSLLFVATGKANLLMYRIYRDFGVSYVKNLSLARETVELVPYNGKLLAFPGNEMVVYNLDESLAASVGAVVPLPFQVLSTDFDGDRLVGVGYNGFVIINMSTDPPYVVDFGGRGGNKVAAENGIVAVSNGHVIHIYNVRDVMTDVDDHPPGSLPATYSLGQNYPNPFNPSTIIEYTLPSRARVQLDIFNILGQKVRTLVNAAEPAGVHRVEWNGTDGSGQKVASGVYFYRLHAGDFVETKKMVLVK